MGINGLSLTFPFSQRHLSLKQKSRGWGGEKSPNNLLCHQHLDSYQDGILLAPNFLYAFNKRLKKKKVTYKDQFKDLFEY